MKKYYNRYSACFEFLITIVFFAIAVYLLTPRYWETGGESWKSWIAARILRETGGFPVFSLGPFYITYLQLFSFFDYPLSIRLEYFLTHLFASIALFYLIKSVVSRKFALMLSCAWMPLMAVVEGGYMVMAIGFFALYLRGSKQSALNTGYFPPSLCVATLCHMVFFPFLVGNIFGVFIKRYRSNQSIFNFLNCGRGYKILYLIINGSLILLIFMTIFYHSSRSDHNHMMMDSTYSPIPSDSSAVTIGFFQLGNHKYVKRNVPESLWMYQDWYFTNKDAYGGAQTILQAIHNNPKTVFDNFIANLRDLFVIGELLFLGSNIIGMGFIVLSDLIIGIGFIGMMHYFWNKNLESFIFSIILGSTGVIAVLLLTTIIDRYVMALLPVGLLSILYIDKGLQVSKKVFLAIGANGHRFIGIALLLVAVVINEWFFPSLARSYSRRIQLLIFEIFFGVTGMTLIFFPNPIVNLLRVTSPKYTTWLRSIIILVSSVCLLISAPYPQGITGQVSAILNGHSILSQSRPISMIGAWDKIISEIDESTKVLALESVWIRAFTKIDLDGPYDVLSLPPFEDLSGETEKLLDTFDLILVNDFHWASPGHSVGTQVQLRYFLHVGPFLEKALARGWSVKSIKNYGKMYYRPK